MIIIMQSAQVDLSTGCWLGKAGRAEEHSLCLKSAMGLGDDAWLGRERSGVGAIHSSSTIPSDLINNLSSRD